MHPGERRPWRWAEKVGKWLYEVVKEVVGRKRVLTFRSQGSRAVKEERAMVEVECWHGVGV